MPVTKPLINTRVVNGSMLKGTNNYGSSERQPTCVYIYTQACSIN